MKDVGKEGVRVLVSLILGLSQQLIGFSLRRRDRWGLSVGFLGWSRRLAGVTETDRTAGPDRIGNGGKSNC